MQLRDDGRASWFATTDLTHAAPAPDPVHRVGPLPSPGALSSLAAIRALAGGGDFSDDRTRGAAVGVPRSFAPDQELFLHAWEPFRAHHVGDATNA